MTAFEKVEQAFTKRPNSLVPGHTLRVLLRLPDRPDNQMLSLNWVSEVQFLPYFSSTYTPNMLFLLFPTLLFPTPSFLLCILQHSCPKDYCHNDIDYMDTKSHPQALCLLPHFYLILVG